MLKKKSQALSFDLVTSIGIFIVIISFVISGIFFSGMFDKPKTYLFEFDYLFRNFERNINDLDDNFLQGSRVNTTKLENFASDYESNSIDNFVLGNTTNTQGIGLDHSAYDICFYFTDNDNLPYNMSVDIQYLGSVKNDDKCQDLIKSNNNPCENYKDALSLFKPVLLDFGDPNHNRIVQMNLVVCII